MLGTDMMADGITKNQSFTLDEKQKPVAEILQTIMQKANPDGKLIGRIRLPERCANLCFGGENRNRLFMAASRSIYVLYVNTQGAVGA